MNDCMPALVVNEAPFVRVPAAGACTTPPLHWVGCNGHRCGERSDKGGNVLSKFRESQRGADPSLTTRNASATIASLSRNVLRARHDVNLTGTPPGIAAVPSEARAPVTIEWLGERPVKVVQPRPD